MPKRRTPLEENLLVARLAFSAAGRNLQVAAREIAGFWTGLSARRPVAVDLAFESLRPADAAEADAIYTGVVTLAGRTLHTEGHPPFSLKPPSPRFAEELHAFSWLAAFSAAGTDLAAANARALVRSWAESGTSGASAWSDDIAARRLIALLGANRLLLSGADPQFLALFLRLVSAHAQRLWARLPAMLAAATRLRALTAIAAARFLTPHGGLQGALEALGRELDRSILPDGCEASRTPSVAADLLFDFVALGRALVAAGIDVPASLRSAIDRMFSALRFFRHMSGDLALFNGTGATDGEALARLFSLDDAGEAVPLRLPQGGFERLSAGGTLVIADRGRPADGPDGANAHAGILSFEMSSGRTRYIVNAGVDAQGPEAFRQIARQSVAHSTLTLDDRSSSLFTARPRLRALLGGARLAGPRETEAERLDAAALQGFRARHDGHAETHGVLHEREITLCDKGGRIEGVDRLLPLPGRTASGQGVIRFHLHPAVHVILDDEGRFLLMADGDDSWTFSADGLAPKLVEAYFFAGREGPARSKAIALEFDAAARGEIAWRFIRVAGARGV